jgi:hypothetical protein
MTELERIEEARCWALHKVEEAKEKLHLWQKRNGVKPFSECPVAEPKPRKEHDKPGVDVYDRYGENMIMHCASAAEAAELCGVTEAAVYKQMRIGAEKARKFVFKRHTE